GGARQVVVLGAGFDGCALQWAGEFPQANFWEIDHPATQRWKAQVLGSADARRLHLVPADLSAGVLPGEALRGSDFDSKAVSFWIAEGLLMYFSESVVQSLIGAISNLTNAGSGLAFSFMEKRDDGRIRFREQSPLVNWWLGRRGEPFLWSASRDEVRELLHSWKDVTFFDDKDLRALGQLEADVPLAAGEIICFATR
ncbi:MAG: SAM-dependent methyltransferase, partial [Verrucomicrobiota bacterium]|nr:SAM-dependent methyltransferase [Verrucomicrobiota bacterium]